MSAHDERVGAADWSSAVDGYGDIEEIKALASLLLTSRGASKKRAAGELTRRLCHEGKTFSAAIPVLSLLVPEIMAHPTKVEPYELDLIANVAAGAGGHTRMLLGRDLTQVDPVAALARAHVVELGSCFSQIFGAGSPETRGALARLASVPTSASVSVRDLLLEQLGRENDGAVSAALCLSIALLDVAQGSTDLHRRQFADLATSRDLMVRAGGAMALALARPSELDEADELVLLEVAESQRQPVPSFAWFEGEVANASAVLLTWSCAARGRIDALSLMLDAIGGAPTERNVAAGMLEAAFGTVPPPTMRLPDRLEPAQRAVVLNLLSRRLEAQLPRALEACGFFGSSAALRQSFGLGAPGPLDVSLGDAPAWFKIVELSSGRMTLAALEAELRDLEVTQRAALVEAAVAGPYPLHLPFPPFWLAPVASATNADELVASHLSRMSALLVSLVPAEAIHERAALATQPPLVALATGALAELAASGARVDRELMVASLRQILANPRYSSVAKAALRVLPVNEREPLVATLKLDHYPVETPAGRVAIARGGWLFVAECPTRGMLDRCVKAVEAWPKTGPWPKRAARAAIRQLREALGADAEELLRGAAVRALLDEPDPPAS